MADLNVDLVEVMLTAADIPGAEFSKPYELRVYNISPSLVLLCRGIKVPSYLLEEATDN